MPFDMIPKTRFAMKLMHNRKLSNQGFTLVELLIVIAIIAVLSTLAVGVMGSASNDAKAAATRARSRIIERVLQTELEDYEVRRIPFAGAILSLTDTIIANGTWSEFRNPAAPFDPISNPRIRLVHFKNLKRMFVADLIRSELPNGRSNVSGLGQYPSPELTSYLVNQLNVATNDPSLQFIQQYALSGGISRWSNWQFDPNFANAPAATLARSREDRIADSAELLYAILGQVNTNGTSALDALGDSAVADTDSDGQLEIVDAWGEPIAFQFHQANLERVNAVVPGDGVWALSAVDANPVTELEVESRPDDTDQAKYNAAVVLSVKPVRVDQINPFVTSENLFEIDQTPPDFNTLRPRD